jgi:hypothetical protein
MAGLSISRAWEESKAILDRDGRLFASVAFALIVFPQTIANLAIPSSPQDISAIAWWVFGMAVLIGFCAQIALNRLAVGPSTTVGSAIGRAIIRMPAFVAVALLWLVAMVIILIVVAMILGAAGLMAPPGVGQEPPMSMVALVFIITVFGYAILQLAIPVAAMETGGPLHLINRSWILGRKAYLRLLVFVMLNVVGLIVSHLAGQFVVGSAVSALLGPPAAGSFSALVISLIAAMIQAGFAVLFAVMLARIYVQLSGRGEVTVPISGT